MTRNSLFISYSHRDITRINWLERLKLYLAPLRRRNVLAVWDDRQLPAGRDWRSEIQSAVDRAATAILLVGPGFIASDFIAEQELPLLLEAATSRGMRIYPLVIGYCQYKLCPLERYQAFNDPANPLEALSDAQQNEILNRLSGLVSMEMLEEAPQSTSDRDQHSADRWTAERAAEYLRTDSYMLAHVYRPSAEPGQKFEIFIFLVRHQRGMSGPPRREFDEIERVEFFLGDSWGNRTFAVPNTGGLLGVRTHAWGTFLATCRIVFADSARTPIVLHRYIDFEMSSSEAHFNVPLPARWDH